MSKGLNTWFDNFGTVPEEVPAVQVKAETQTGGSRRRKRRVASRKSNRRGGSRKRKHRTRKH